MLQLSSRDTGYLYCCRAPVREWEKHGKFLYRHLHWLPVNPSSPSQLSWSRPDDQGPALLPCQADSSVFSIPPVGACSSGTDRKRNSRHWEWDRLAKISTQASQTQNPVTYREAKTLLHSWYNRDWKKENGGCQADIDPLWRLEWAQQTTIFCLRTGHCGLSAHLKRIGTSDTSLCVCADELTKPQTTSFSPAQYIPRDVS